MKKVMYSFLPEYPFQEEKTLSEFNKEIQGKREFSELSIPKVEILPSTLGEPLKHQKLLSRYLSDVTPYNGLLLYHEMGTGKTCSSVQISETLLNSKSDFKGCLYVSRNKGLNENFINELIFRCTKGQYKPEGWDRMSVTERGKNIRKKIKGIYTTQTYEVFSKKIQRLSNENLRKQWDNKLIIIDEVQNLRLKEKGGGIETYKNFWEFLHSLKHSKILLLSGTPMKNTSSEFASVMNLLLPENEQLPIDKKFDRIVWKDGYNKISSEGVSLLEKAIKGRVSYLESQKPENVKRIDKGVKVKGVQGFKVVPSIMSKFQSKYYMEAWNSDKISKGVYDKSRQASLFVFPDGTWGTAGIGKYIKEIKSAGVLKGYSLTPEFRKELNTKGTEKEKLVAIRKFSSKYADSIQDILENTRNGKTTFVYNEFVSGGGLLLFAELLKLFGWSRWSGREQEEKTFILLTGLTPSGQIKQLINRFNKPDNVNGKFIQVVLGSRVISEGYTFKNVQAQDIQTPWFNYSDTKQVLGRVFRLGSHNALLQKKDTVEIETYHRVSILGSIDNKDSIELNMYKLASSKEEQIQKIKEFVKTHSFDCDFFRKRNMPSFCEGQENTQKDEVDTSNLDLLYYDIVKTIDKITPLLEKCWEITISELMEKLPKHSQFNIIKAIALMVSDKYIVINKNIPCYVFTQGEKVYLGKTTLPINEYNDRIYTQKVTGTISLKSDDLQQLIPSIEKERESKILEDFCKGDTNKLPLLQLNTQAKLLESAVLVNKPKIPELKKVLLDKFSDMYSIIDGVKVHWILYPKIYYYSQSEKMWLEGDSKLKKKIDTELEKEKDKFENNPYGYYGQENPKTKEFCIRDVSQKKEMKKHKRTSGRVCTTLPKKKLLDIIVNNLKIPPPAEDDKWKKIQEGSDEDTLKKLQSSRYLQNTKKKDAKIALYWSEQKTDDICVIVKEWFEKNRLLSKDIGCGKLGKVKI